MGLSGEVANNPASFVLGCLVMIPVAIWVYSMISWSVTQDIDPMFGIPAALLGLGLGVMVIKPPHPSLSPLFFFAIVGMMVAYPFILKASRSRMMASIDYHEMERAYEALRNRPDNAAAQLKLAESLYSRGFVDLAMTLGQGALTRLNPTHFQREHQMVAAWGRYLTKPITELRCLACGTLNDPSQPLCVRCREPYLMYHARSKFVKPKFVVRILGAWLAGMLLVVALPTVVLIPIAPGVKIALILLLMVGAGFMLIRAFGLLRQETTA